MDGAPAHSHEACHLQTLAFASSFPDASSTMALRPCASPPPGPQSQVCVKSCVSVSRVAAGCSIHYGWSACALPCSELPAYICGCLFLPRCVLFPSFPVASSMPSCVCIAIVISSNVFFRGLLPPWPPMGLRLRPPPEAINRKMLVALPQCVGLT